MSVSGFRHRSSFFESLGGLALDALVGSPPLPLPEWLRSTAAVGVAMAGFSVIAPALALFRKVGTRPEPRQPSSALTTA